MAEGNDKISAGFVPLLQQELPRHVLAGFMRYQKIRTLGKGGKAEVFLCRDQTLGREVAVKVPHPDLLPSPEEQHMLVREARIMAVMLHPGIPKIHDLGRDFEARPYFAMSYVPGITFREMLNHAHETKDFVAQQYCLQQCVNILIDVGSILEVAHAMHIVHGDLKPENILLDQQGGAHLIDWGLATILDRGNEIGGEADTFASEREMQGSPLYMSPEQASHEATISAATDIYSLGVMLYECLTHTVPFQGECVDEVLAKVVSCEPESPSQRAPDRYLSLELERTCMQAIAKDPAHRQANMQELVAELRDCHLELLIDYDHAIFPPSMPAQQCRHEEGILAYV